MTTDMTSSSFDVLLPGVPATPGLRLRPPVGPSDFGPMTEVYAAAAAADGLDDVVTEADMANFIENPVNSDPAHDWRIAEVDGRVIGYSWVSHRVELSGDEVHLHRGYVHPDWRRRGVGTALLRHAWGRAGASRLVTDPAATRVLATFQLETETGGHALARRYGYQPIRYSFDMLRDLSAPIPALPMPEGIEVRPALPEHRRLIWEAEREAFRDHWAYAPWPEEAFQRFVEFPHYDLSLWRVAWEGDQVVGSVLSYINDAENKQHARRRGHTEDISVRRPWRRRGLARTLIAQSLEALKARGMEEAALAVDAENLTGALRVYESLGFVVVKRWTVYQRALPVPSDGTERARGT